MTRVTASLSLTLVLATAPAWADRVKVFSVQGADCATCADKIKDELKKELRAMDVAGVK